MVEGQLEHVVGSNLYYRSTCPRVTYRYVYTQEVIVLFTNSIQKSYLNCSNEMKMRFNCTCIHN